MSPSDERVWTEFKGLFLAIDKGNSRVKPPINAYNGGLFAYDNILDNLKIKDDAWEKLIELASYDFETDLNVNILGHIFEQSISDLESIKESLTIGLEQGGSLLTEDGNKVAIDTKESLVEKVGKRKKDGIFYTPEYITRYIVENTVGKYLGEHPDQLETVTILDPACGSGAFLNQAHSFLLKTHKENYDAKINEKLQKGEGITLFDYNPAEADRGILLNNLYGVDLNQESVDITKLALWLKTARRTEPLQSLDRNIKCGNSLIDDPKLAGDKAFDWKKQFSEILDNKGFDVIVGNPPWVFSRGQKYQDEIKNYFEDYLKNVGLEKKIKGNNIQSGKVNLYALFLIKSIELLNNEGYLGFIVPNTLLRSTTYNLIREYILKNTKILQIVDLGEGIFENVTASSILIILQKNSSINNHETEIILGNPSEIGNKRIYKIKQSEFLNNVSYAIDILNSPIEKILSKKICINSVSLGDICKNISPGIDANKDKYVALTKLSDNYKPLLMGRDINRFVIRSNPLHFVLYDRGLLNRARDEDIFLAKKIVIQRISGGFTPIKGAIDNGQYYTFNSVNNILIKDSSIYSYEFILGILNSKLINWYYSVNFSNKSFLTVNISKTYLERLPIVKKNDQEQSVLVKLVNKITNLISSVDILKTKANDFIEAEFHAGLLIFNKDYSITGWNEFIELLNHKGVILEIEKKEKLFEWFKSKQYEIKELHSQVKMLNNDIDNEVYKLYELSEEEIKIVESSTNL